MYEIYQIPGAYSEIRLGRGKTQRRKHSRGGGKFNAETVLSTRTISTPGNIPRTYEDPLTPLELINYYLTLAMISL